jgi:hypothetical protein
MFGSPTTRTVTPRAAMPDRPTRAAGGEQNRIVWSRLPRRRRPWPAAVRWLIGIEPFFTI